MLGRFAIDETLAKTCGWVWWHENVLAISDRPLELHRDSEGRLHSTTGPSIAYRDGWQLFHVHGVSVPEEWILRPASINAQTALTWKNAEQRRAAVELLGWSKILQAVSARVIDRDTDPMIGVLLAADLPDAPNQRFLQVKCGTGREFVLPVPPDVQTAAQANAWTYGIDEKLLNSYKART